MFFVLSFILSLSAIIVTLKILVGYNPEFSLRRKLSIAFVIVLAWFSPAIAGLIRWLRLLPEKVSVYTTQGLYTLFIAAMFLLGILLVRDLFWIHGYQIARKSGKASPDYDPMRPEAIKKANLAAVLATLLLTCHSLYEGTKFPAVKETVIETDKVDYPFKIVALTDTHINPATSVSRVERLVRRVNGLKPDVVALVGDIGDAKPAFVKPQMKALSGLDAKYGVFVTLGNHEFYHGSMDWENEFKRMGFFYLANEGLYLNGADIYVFGLPDPQLLMISEQAMENIKNRMKAAPNGAYRVFLSHSPRFIKRLSKDLIDLQISGHTHGGQIFPFHFFVKRFNDFVAGLYDVNGMKLYVSRGAGEWGAPMRLFAPSEISVITLIPSGNKATE
ncbi:MAG: metallophosphoesterase [Alphaproteobacteria bacterium]|nr:metallophosphoesterase [Alphaproteobacteria bacterium]